MPVLLFRIQIIFPFQALTWESYAFVALITFAAYFYLKVICFSSHYPKLEKPNQIHWWLLFFIVLCATYPFIQFKPQTQLVICAIGCIGMLFHNHSSFYFFRNIILVKNICISICWVLLLFYSFQEDDFTNTKRFFYALDFFFILLAQSLLFDFQEAKEDQAFLHKTLSYVLPVRKLKTLILILFFINFLCLFLFYTQQWINLKSLLIVAPIYGVYLIYATNQILNKKTTNVIFTDLILILKTI